jgi:hypothetical protein
VVNPPSAPGQTDLGEPKTFANYRLNGFLSEIPATPSTLGYASPPNPPTSPPVLSPQSTFHGLRTHVSSLSTSSEPPIGQPYNRARSQSLALDPIRSIWRTTSDTRVENRTSHSRIATPSSLLYPTPAFGPAMQSPWVFPLANNSFRPTERPTSTTTPSALPPRVAPPTTGPAGPPPGHVFDTLIELLEKWRLQGNSQPLRSLVGAELPKRNPSLYQRAGVSTFGEYVRLAEREGVIRLGAGNYPGSEWIALEIKYCGRVYTTSEE